MPDHRHIRDWLKLLAGLCKGSTPPDELQLKIGLFVPMLAEEFTKADYFCPASLRFVGKQCTYFPAFAELCEHLNAWKRSQNPYPIYGGDPGYAGYLTHDPPPPEARGAQNDEQRRQASEMVRSVSEQLAILGEAKHDAIRAQLPPRPQATPLSRAQLVEAYKQAGIKGPQTPKPTPLRAAATTIPPETRRGPAIDGDAPDA